MENYQFPSTYTAISGLLDDVDNSKQWNFELWHYCIKATICCYVTPVLIAQCSPLFHLFSSAAGALLLGGVPVWQGPHPQGQEGLQHRGPPLPGHGAAAAEAPGGPHQRPPVHGAAAPLGAAGAPHLLPRNPPARLRWPQQAPAPPHAQLKGTPPSPTEMHSSRN